MVKLARYLSLLTIVALNAILLIAAGSDGQILGHSASFSLLLGYLNWKSHRKTWALLFFVNIFIVLIPTLLSISGLIKLPSIVLISLDLYWLNQYWVYATLYVKHPVSLG